MSEQEKIGFTIEALARDRAGRELRGKEKGRGELQSVGSEPSKRLELSPLRA